MEISKSITSSKSKNYFCTLEETFNKVHNNQYDYKDSIFIGASNAIEIRCKEHGLFSQRVSDHKNGRGCPECGKLKSAQAKKMSLQEFIEKATERHEGLYSYTNTILGKDNKATILVTCNEHGEFPTSPNNHLRNSGGCPKCKLIKDKTKSSLWSYSEWEKAGKASTNFTGFKLYVVECWDNDEKFIKIGKTFTTISKRFIYYIPYDFKVLYSIEGSARFISELETDLHNKNKEFKYCPVKEFGGMEECFSISIAENLSQLVNF